MSGKESHDLVACSYVSAVGLGLPVEAYDMSTHHDILLSFVWVLGLSFLVCAFFSFSLIPLIADGPHHYHPAWGHKGSSHLSRFTPYNLLSRYKFSTLTTRQPMVEFYLLTFPHFPLQKKEHKSYFGNNRTHDFRTSRCAGYLPDHSGDYMSHILL